MPKLIPPSLCLLLASLSTSLLASDEIKIPIWYLALDCRGYTHCYAASNGSYTGTFSNARTFTERSEAEAFLNSLTRNLSDKSPRLLQTWQTQK